MNFLEAALGRQAPLVSGTEHNLFPFQRAAEEQQRTHEVDQKEEEDLKKEESQLNEMHREHAQLDEVYRSTQAHLAETLKELDMVNNTLSENEKHDQELEEQATQMNQIMETFHEDLKAISKKVTELATRIQHEESNRAQEESTLAKITSELLRNDSKLKTIQDIIADRKKAIKTLQVEKEAIMADIAELQRNLDQLKEERMAVHSDIKELELEVSI